MRMPSVKLCAVFLTACALAGPASPRARAGFESSFTGNTQMSDVTSPQGVVSFSVFSNTGGGNFVTAINSALNLTGGNALTASSLSGGNAIDFNAKYVYLYQSVVFGGDISQLKVANPEAFTSAGYFSGKVFQDTNQNGKPVGDKVNNSNYKGLGTDPTTDDVAGNATPSLSGVTLQKIVSLSSSQNPSSSNLSTGGSGGFVAFNFEPALEDTRNKHLSSSVVFLTSNFAPQYLEGQLRDSGLSNGDIPTAVTPEPGSFVLCGLGVGLLGFYGWRRRGLNAQPAVA